MVLKGENAGQGPGATARPPVPRSRGESGSVDELYTASKSSVLLLVLSEQNMSKLHTWIRQPRRSRIKNQKGWKEARRAGVMEVCQRGVIPVQSWCQRLAAASSGGFCGRSAAQRSRQHKCEGELWGRRGNIPSADLSQLDKCLDVESSGNCSIWTWQTAPAC